MAGALEGIRVLDLTRVLAGPMAMQTLADLGAEVIKIERPGTGDDSRGWGPPFVETAQGGQTPDSTYFASCNRGKKSVTLDISKPEAQDIVRRLATQSDVLAENYKVGDLERYGLDTPAACPHPRLVYCSITGYANPTLQRRAGYDPIVQAMGGLMSVTGQPTAFPARRPLRWRRCDRHDDRDLRVSGILAALLHRGRAVRASTSTWHCSTCRSLR
jgi:crotonobetainyl-CoA:carnitine CoA-transferase CaiB-like acyl-CoA transferase